MKFPHHSGGQSGAHGAGSWLSVLQAAAYMNISEPSVRRLIKRNAFPYCKIGRKILIHRDSLDGFMRGGGDAREGGPVWPA